MWREQGMFGGPVIMPPGVVTKRLMGLTVGVFLVEWLLWQGSADSPFLRVFALSRRGIAAGMLWQPLTYAFLHGGWMHLLMNMLGLFFLGRELEYRLGSRRFLLLYLGSGVLGGLGWLLLAANPHMRCLGASGAVFGIIGAFAALYPHRQITLLLFYVVPVTLSARTLALALGLVSIVMLRGNADGIAHAAHLAGGVAGYVYGSRISGSRPAWRTGWNGFSDWRAHLRRDRFRVMHEPDDAPVDWQAVDRILEKVRREGMDSLTRGEREVLDRASRRA